MEINDHLTLVLEAGAGAKTDQQYQTSVSNAFTTWLTQQRDKSKVIINNGWANYVPTSPTLAQAQANQNAIATTYVETSQAQSTP